MLETDGIEYDLRNMGDLLHDCPGGAMPWLTILCTYCTGRHRRRDEHDQHSCDCPSWWFVHEGSSS